MDFVTAPVILKAISERTAHGVFGYSRWQHNDFLSAVAHWFSSRFQAQIDTQALVYGPSVIYMVSQMIRLWSQPVTVWWCIPRRMMHFIRRSPVISAPSFPARCKNS